MLNYLLKARNSKKGFTIIELVIVIAVIGVLSAVLVPNFSSTIFKAESTATAANISTFNKIAKSALTETDTSMLKAYAAVVQNFGYDNVKKTVADTVYSSTDHCFTSVKKVDTSEGYDLSNYWPVTATEDQTALECFSALPFVTKVDGAQNFVSKINAEQIIDDSGKYNAVYFVMGSVALYDDLNLGDAAVVFLDGASLELNGKTLGCKSVTFLDTTGGKNEIVFRVNGGMINTFLGYAIYSASNFWKDESADKTVSNMNLTADPKASDSNKISFYQDAIIETTLGGAYVNVANCSYYLYGGVLLAGAGTFTLDGDSHFVVADGAYLLTDNGDTAEAKEYSAVKICFDTGAVDVDISDKSVVALWVDDGSKDVIINGHNLGTDLTWNSVNPLTYEVCASAVQNTLILYAQAGADLGTVMTIADKFSASVNNTVSTLSAVGLVTASNAAASISSANTAMAQTVYGAVTSASSATTAVAGNAAAGAIASLAGVNTKAGLVNLAANTAAGSSSSVNATVSTVDYTWYSEKTSTNTNGYTLDGSVKVYHITTAKQLYTLSWIVAKGLDDFSGSVVSIDADLDLSEYQPWQPIGNGTYGFRGYMNGNGHKISNMRIDTESLTTITSLVGQAWSGTANHAKNEGVNYGIQTGDKYAVGFIGVLENGGTLTNINFSNCTVKFNYNWNCSAAIAVGAIITTGEDYSYQHDGNVITGDPSGDYNFVTYGEETSASQKYHTNGPKWITGTDGNVTGADNTCTEYSYRAYKGWITTVSNVTTDSGCYVECSGRPGGIIGSTGDRYGAGSPNNTCDKYRGYSSSADDNSIFAAWGTLNIDSCTNNATVKQNLQKSGYSDTAGIAAYFINHGGSGYKWNIKNCVNNGEIIATETNNAAEITADVRGSGATNDGYGVYIYGCTGRAGKSLYVS